MRVKGKQEEEQREWERERWHAYMMMRMHPYMKQKPNTPQAWVKFPWEQEERKEKLDWHTSEEESQRLRDIITEYRKRHGQDR